MSKYIIEIPDGVPYVLLRREDFGITKVVPVADLEELTSDYINEHYGELQDEAYQAGLNDAWEAARRIVVDTDHGGLALGTLSEIFGTQSYSYIMRENTAQEAIDKIKTYDNKRSDRIEVGDIVERYVDGKLDSKGIYLQEDGGYWRCLFDTGAVFMTFAYPKGQFKKTGKHYDIASILEAMRE